MGCCMGLSSSFEFNNQTKQLKADSYMGCCCCCGKHEIIPFEDIVGLYL
jgi:hypothetical protein